MFKCYTCKNLHQHLSIIIRKRLCVLLLFELQIFPYFIVCYRIQINYIIKYCQNKCFAESNNEKGNLSGEETEAVAQKDDGEGSSSSGASADYDDSDKGNVLNLWRLLQKTSIVGQLDFIQIRLQHSNVQSRSHIEVSCWSLLMKTPVEVSYWRFLSKTPIEVSYWRLQLLYI